MTLRVYDVTGRLVRTLHDRHTTAGSHVASWNGRDDLGARAASGVYFYRIDAGGRTHTRKMTLLR